MLARAIARSVEGTAFARIQCTPDLQPSDVTGVNIYDQKLQDFEFRRGPLFANVVLVDEINRAMPKTQSALLEAMAERQVTIDGQTYVLPRPFLAARDREPDRVRGLFPLPEAQLDRFFLKARLGYPGEENELAVVLDQQDGHPLDRLQPVPGRGARPLEASLAAVYMDELVSSGRRLVSATRELPEVVDRRLGARQPRARAGLPCLGAARRAGLHDTRRRRARCSPPSSATGSSSRRPHRRVARPVARRDRERGLPALRRRGAAARSRRRRRGRAVDVAELTFPLVPRWRPVGSAFGRLRAARRGIGSSVATTRSYVPGDDLQPIDWKLSARLSSIRGSAEFIVREDFADEAPRAVVVADRRSVHGRCTRRICPGSPSRPRSARSGRRSPPRRRRSWAWPATSTPPAGDCWFTPRPKARFAEIEARARDAPFDAVQDGLEAAFDHLGRSRRSLPAGTFVFVCSDFLDPPRATTWLHALGVRWDPVPVVVQDPVWEQGFPAVDGLVVPFADPVTGRIRQVRISAGEARRLRELNEARLASLLAEFGSLGLDYVVVGESGPDAVVRAFVDWAEARIAYRRGAWR